MIGRWFYPALALAAASTSHAADGLSAARAETPWPSWQARIYLQTSAIPSPASGIGQELKGGAILGDYFLARRSFGVLRATSGIVAGSLAGAPLYKSSPGQLSGMVVQSSGLQPKLLVSTEQAPPLPYLGLGFSTAPVASGLSVSADFGLVAQNPGHGIYLGRALLGNQGIERAFRELRLAPMAQLSVRYGF